VLEKRSGQNQEGNIKIAALERGVEERAAGRGSTPSRGSNLRRERGADEKSLFAVEHLVRLRG